MKTRFASFAKGLRVRALIFALVLVTVPTLWMSASFSQDGVSSKTPAHVPSDATALARIMSAQRSSGGPIPPDAYENAMKQWAAISTGAPVTSLGSPKSKTLSGSVTGLVWKPIGPSGINAGSTVWNGRIDSISISPTNPSVIYIGATDGGIWKTINAGATWTPLTDHQPMLAIGEPGAIAIDPNNVDTVYVGTSSFLKVTGAQGTQLNTTIGILKTTDGGASWIVLGSGFPAGNNGNANQFVNQSIFGIAVDPANSANLYLAASTGLFFSTDSGQNWTLGTGGGGGQAESLAFDASSPVGNRTLFAGVNGVGIKRSIDGGNNWAQVLNTTTPAVATQLAAHSGAGIGKIQVSLAPSVGNAAGVQVVYATIEGTGGDFPIPNDPYTNILGIFETTDQGVTWTFQGTGPNLAGGVCQCFYTNTLAVDPGSPGDGINDILYWGGTDTWKSVNSGVSFADITNGIHADSHSWAFAPGTPSIVYAGNDGGIWRSIDGGAIWTGTGGPPATINAGGLQTGLLYHMDIKRNATADVTLGAFQDNGDNKWTGAPAWVNTLGGDGLNVIFDLQSVATAYAIDNGGPNISTDSGSTWADITNNIPKDPHTNNQIQTFANAITVDPNNAGFLYFSGAANTSVPPPMPAVNNPGQLFQSENFGATWTQITNFAAFTNVGPSAVAPANSNYLAVIDGNSLYITPNVLAATPSFFLIPGTTSLAITRLAFDPNDPTVLYFVTAGFSGFPGGHVFKVKFSVVAGPMVLPVSITDVSPPIDVPFDGLALDGASSPTTIYAGSDLGVMRSVDGGVTWTTLDALHFPNAVVSDLQINPTAGVLRASTYGRGVFEFAAATGPVIAVNAQNNLEFGPTCAGSTVSLNLEVFNVGTTNLIVSSVLRQAGSTDFTVAPNPTTPVTISPDAHVDFTIQFTPTIVGPQSATIAINSNDPGAPSTVLTATGSEGNGTINVTGSGNFGSSVCAGSLPPAQTLKINNTGTCNLDVASAVISCPDFTLVNPAEFPATISADSSLDVGVNFTPTSAGPKACTLTINSDDPNNPVVVIPLNATTPMGTALLTFPGGLTFPPTVIQASGACSAEPPVPVTNGGSCPVQINSIGLTQASSPPDYALSGVPGLPINLGGGQQLGSGDLDLNFAPFTIARESTGTVDVNFVNDPITGATTTTHVPFCGEATLRGMRILVTLGGVPVAGPVKRILLQEAFGPEQQFGIFTLRTVKKATLQTVTGVAPCPTFQFHAEFGGVSNPIQLKDGTYRVKVELKVGKKLMKKVVRVNMDECTFTQNVVVAF